jgi:magnesium transporter
MARFIKDRSAAKGQVPGSLILIGKQKMEETLIQLMDIEGEQLVEREMDSIEELMELKDSSTVSWINIWGIHDLELIRRIGEILDLHSLVLEDILNTDQPPTYDAGDNCDIFILKLLRYDKSTRMIQADQLTLILGKNYVLTLQEQSGELFKPLRERIRNTKKRVRFIDSDYLAYSLLDTVADSYMQITETLGRQIEDLEERLFKGPDPKLVEEIYFFKTELSFLRKSIRPVREIMSQVMRIDNGLFQEKYMSYMRDLNDLVVQTTDAIELYSGMISDHLNIYSTNVNNRTNEVMKVLTIFAAIFIPLTFLAGIYGMNFEYIPELGFKYSYLIFWIIVLAIGIGLLLYFKRKKWF